LLTGWVIDLEAAVILQPSSGTAERVFAMQRTMFSNLQRSSRRDYQETALMTRYNENWRSKVQQVAQHVNDVDHWIDADGGGHDDDEDEGDADDGEGDVNDDDAHDEDEVEDEDGDDADEGERWGWNGTHYEFEPGVNPNYSNGDDGDDDDNDDPETEEYCVQHSCS
jgi:hypothetical protein